IRCFFAACAVLCCLCPPSCVLTSRPSSFLFFFNDTATPEIYTLSLHDALPISWCASCSPIPSGGSGSSSTGLSNGPGKPAPKKGPRRPRLSRLSRPPRLPGLPRLPKTPSSPQRPRRRRTPAGVRRRFCFGRVFHTFRRNVSRPTTFFREGVLMKRVVRAALPLVPVLT